MSPNYYHSTSMVDSCKMCLVLTRCCILTRQLYFVLLGPKDVVPKVFTEPFYSIPSKQVLVIQSFFIVMLRNLTFNLITGALGFFYECCTIQLWGNFATSFIPGKIGFYSKCFALLHNLSCCGSTNWLEMTLSPFHIHRQP